MGLGPTTLALLLTLTSAVTYDRVDVNGRVRANQGYDPGAGVVYGVPIGCSIVGLFILGTCFFLLYYCWIRKYIEEKRIRDNYGPPPPAAIYKSGPPPTQPEYYNQQNTQSAYSFSYDKEPTPLDRSSNASFPNGGTAPVPILSAEPGSFRHSAGSNYNNVQLQPAPYQPAPVATYQPPPTATYQPPPTNYGNNNGSFNNVNSAYSNTHSQVKGAERVVTTTTKTSRQAFFGTSAV